MIEVFGLHGIPEVVHADRGTAMTSRTVATLLSDLEVTNSHSRPRASIDNPLSESFPSPGSSLRYSQNGSRPWWTRGGSSPTLSRATTTPTTTPASD